MIKECKEKLEIEFNKNELKEILNENFKENIILKILEETSLIVELENENGVEFYSKENDNYFFLENVDIMKLKNGEKIKLEKYSYNLPF